MKKRVLSLLLVLLMVVTLMPVSALAAGDVVAYEVAGGNIYFNKATRTITDCDESVTRAHIPEKIDGVAVENIGLDAFRDCTSLSYVEIPSTITYIDNAAFYGCASLKMVEIPGGVTSIRDYTFSGCTSLARVTIPTAVTNIWHYAFSGCTSLTDVYYTGSETQWNEIDIERGNECLTKATIHYHTHDFVAEVTEPTCIEEGYTTYTCTLCGYSYTSDKVPAQGHSPVLVGAKDATCTTDGYTGDKICSVCKMVLSKGENIAHFGHEYKNGKCATCGAIDTDNVIDSGYCGGEGDGTNLTWTLYKNGTLEISGTGAMASWNTYYGDRKASDAPWSYHNGEYINKKITSIVISEGVTSIGHYAFVGCDSLTDVQLPKSVTSIKEAFYECGGSVDLVLPEGIKGITNEYGFAGFYGLRSITIPDSAGYVNPAAFERCTQLERFNVSEGNTYYSSHDGVLFDKDKTTLEIYPSGKADTYVIPNGVIHVGYHAFFANANITNISIPSSVTDINASFVGCTNLKNVEISEGVTSIGGAFENCTSLESIRLPDSIMLFDRAFKGCTSLKSINIPANVMGIGNRAFQGCTSLESIEIPHKVEGIGQYAFYECTSLSSVSLPLNLVLVEYAAFFGCNNLKDVYYKGDAVQWNKIDFTAYNEPLINATIHMEEHVHSYDNASITAPTCTEQGYTTHTCACGESIVDTYVPANGHKLNARHICTVCGIRQALNHNFVSTVTAPTCTEQGYTTYTCSCGETYTKNYVSALGHKTALYNAVEPTCTEAGYTGDEVCTICGEVISQGETIDATGHHFKGNTCTVCGDTRSTADTIRAFFQDSFNSFKSFFDRLFGR